MWTLMYLLLIVRVGCCKEDHKFVTNTVDVGQNVTLMCPHEKAPLYQETLFWIRFVSGNWPEFLGAAFSFKYDRVTKTPHIKVNQAEGTFILHIHGAKLSDTGLYYCVKVKQLDVIFINGTFLKIKGSESDVTAVIQEALSDPARPGDPVTLQCSVLSDTERKTCSADPRVFWFRAGSDETHPKLIYTHGNSREECEKSREADFTQKCVYDFSKNISPSDTGTFYCAVATCGEILFGNGVKLEIEATSKPSAVFPIYVILVVIVSAVTIYVIMERLWDRSSARVSVRVKNGTWKNLKCIKDKQLYSTAVFSAVTAGCANAEMEKIYAAFLQDS